MLPNKPMNIPKKNTYVKEKTNSVILTSLFWNIDTFLDENYKVSKLDLIMHKAAIDKMFLTERMAGPVPKSLKTEPESSYQSSKQ